MEKVWCTFHQNKSIRFNIVVWCFNFKFYPVFVNESTMLLPTLIQKPIELIMQQKVFFIFIIYLILKTVREKVIIHINGYGIQCLIVASFPTIFLITGLTNFLYLDPPWLSNSSMQYILKVLFNIFNVISEYVATILAWQQSATVQEWKVFASALRTCVFSAGVGFAHEIMMHW